MKRACIAIAFLILVPCLTGCRHVTFTRTRLLKGVAVQYPIPEPISGMPGPLYLEGERLVLEITRNVDHSRFVIDDEESELLQLELKDYTVGEKVRIPSNKVTPYFRITRFGPTSYGQAFDGHLIITGASEKRIDAFLNLNVRSNTWRKGRLQTSVFRGEYNFVEQPAPNRNGQLPLGPQRQVPRRLLCKTSQRFPSVRTGNCS